MPRLPPRRGVAHTASRARLLAFSRIPDEDKLRWLEEMRRFVDKFTTARQRKIRIRFRRGEI